MKGIILTAGVGRRLYPLTKDIPKGLLKVSVKTILEYQIDFLCDYGIKDIVLVVGHGAKKVKEVIGNKVKYVFNPKYKDTNNIFSLWVAREEIRGFDCVLIHGDTIFYPKILKRLVTHKGDICLAIHQDDVREMIRVKVKGGLITEINKTMSSTEAYGNFVGIAKFSAKVSNLVVEEIEKFIRKKKTDVFYSDSINELIQKGIKVYPVLTDNLPCCDIDDKKDYQRAKRIFKGEF